jgi:hypothetical protein
MIEEQVRRDATRRDATRATGQPPTVGAFLTTARRPTNRDRSGYAPPGVEKVSTSRPPSSGWNHGGAREIAVGGST